jgi:hypothetical protein
MDASIAKAFAKAIRRRRTRPLWKSSESKAAFELERKMILSAHHVLKRALFFDGPYSLFRSGLLSALLTCGVSSALSAADSPLSSFESGQMKDIQSSADAYEYVGNNLIAKGHAVIRYRTCSFWRQGYINIASKDVELVGDVSFVRRAVTTKKVDYWEYQDLLDDPSLKVEIEQYVTTASGRQFIEVSIKRTTPI